MSKVVHFHLFDPSRTIFKSISRDPAESTTITCELENCSLRDNGQCMLAKTFSPDKCPYGKLTREKGFGKSAKSFYPWIRERNEKYKGVPCLHGAVNKLAFVGDYVYLPYPHINLKDGMGGQNNIPIVGTLIERKDWTIETVLKIIDFRPRSLFGGEIFDYQKESVPLFIQHLHEVDHLMYQAIITARPELDKTPDYVGRVAYLKTLKPNIVIPAYNAEYPVVWKWDGEFLTTNSANAYDSAWGKIPAKSVELRMVPQDDATVKVVDNSWVTENTKFKD